MAKEKFVFLHTVIPDEVFHYTNSAAALSILEKCKIRLTSLLFMNDNSELHYALGKASDILSDHRKLLDDKDNKKDNARRVAYDKVSQYFLDALLSDCPLEKDPRTYIYSASFCCDGDLLSQWRSYCADEGLAISFDKKFIESFIDSHYDDYNVVCAKCFYSEQEFVDRVNAAINHVSTLIDQAGPFAFDSMKIFGDDGLIAYEEDLKSFLLSICCLYKHEGFKEEAEFRIAVISNEVDCYGKKLGTPKFYAGGGMLKPYYEIDFEPSHVNKVLLKPSDNVSQLNKSMSLYFLHNQAKYPAVTVVESKIPYRG